MTLTPRHPPGTGKTASERTGPAVMIGRPTVRQRFHRVPKWSLWRCLAGALGKVLACLAHRDACPAGGGADAGDRREQGVLP